MSRIFPRREGNSLLPFISEDPLVCAHQAIRLKVLLATVLGHHEETCVVLSRLELVYLCANRPEDADRVAASKRALVPPPAPDEGHGFSDRMAWLWRLHQTDMRFRRGQLAVEQHLADLHRLAPWEADSEIAKAWGMS